MYFEGAREDIPPFGLVRPGSLRKNLHPKSKLYSFNNCGTHFPVGKMIYWVGSSGQWQVDSLLGQSNTRWANAHPVNLLFTSLCGHNYSCLIPGSLGCSISLSLIAPSRKIKVHSWLENLWDCKWWCQVVRNYDLHVIYKEDTKREWIKNTEIYFFNL